MKRFELFAYALLSSVLLALACARTTQPPPSVGTLITDSGSCVANVVATVEGAPDVASLLQNCGGTVAGVIAEIQSLARKNQNLVADAGKAALSPARAAYASSLEAWLAAAKSYQQTHPNPN